MGRIKRDGVPSEGVRVMRIPAKGGDQEASAMPLKIVNSLLFGIDENRVKPELRDGVIAYGQRSNRKGFCESNLMKRLWPSLRATTVVGSPELSA